MDLALLCACLLLAAENPVASAQPTPAQTAAAESSTSANSAAAPSNAPAHPAAKTPARLPRQQVPFPPRAVNQPALPLDMGAAAELPPAEPTPAEPTLAEPAPALPVPTAAAQELTGPADPQAALDGQNDRQPAGPVLSEPLDRPGRSALVMPASPQNNPDTPATLQPTDEPTLLPTPAPDAGANFQDAPPAPSAEAEAANGEPFDLPRILPANAERSALRRNRENEAAETAPSREQTPPAVELQGDVVDPFSRPAASSEVVPAGGVQDLPDDSPASNRIILGGERGPTTEGWERAADEVAPRGNAPQQDQQLNQRNALDAGNGPDNRYGNDGPNNGPNQSVSPVGPAGPGNTMPPREPIRSEFDSSGFSGRLLDEPGSIQRTAGESADDRRLPPASNDSGALVPVQPQVMSTEPRRGMAVDGVVPEASPRAVPADADLSHADLANDPAQPDTAARLVRDLFSPKESGVGQGGEAAAANLISLKDVLQRSSQPSERLALVQNYWRMAAVAAEYRAVAQYADILKQLADAYRSEPGGVPPEVSAALATAQARQQETLVQWAEASSRLSLTGAAAGAPKLLRPSDLPHAGRYRTEFEHLFASRPAPPRVVLLNQLLPYRYQAVQRRADAVAAATDQAVAADEAFRRGELSLSRFLVALRRETEEQLRFLYDVQTYNDDIAEYAISATGGNLPLATLAETLVKAPQAPRQPAAGAAVPQAAPQGTSGIPQGGFPAEVIPPGTVVPQRSGVPTEALPVPNTPSNRATAPGAAPISPLSPGAALPPPPNGVVQASGAQTAELPGRSILKATSTLPSGSAQPSMPSSPAQLRPIPQAVRPMSGSPSMVPAPFPQPQRAVPLQAGSPAWGPQPTPAMVPSSAPSPGSTTPVPSGTNDGWRESVPDTRQPAGQLQPAPGSPAPAVPALDRMTLRPLSHDGEPLAGLPRLAGAPPNQCAAHLRDAFYGSLPWEPLEQPLAGVGLPADAAAARWWTLLQRLADERSLEHFLTQLADLQDAASQQARGAGDYPVLAVRTVRFSMEADLASAQAATTVARAMLREVAPATLANLPKLPRLPADQPSDHAGAGPSGLESLKAQHVETAAVAVAAQAAAVAALRRQWQQAGRPIEEVLDALTASRQVHITWLTAVTRYQERTL